MPPASPGPAAGVAPFDAYHLQLVDLSRDVPAGTSIDLTFQFRKAPPVTLAVPVRPRQAQDDPGHLVSARHRRRLPAEDPARPAPR
jgi:hypothetical protein